MAASAEYFHRSVSPKAAALANREAAGWYVQAGAVVIPATIEVGGRYSALDRDLDVVGGSREAGPFLNWFIHGHDLKLQADAAWLTTRLAAGTLHDLRIRTSLVVLF